MFLNIFFPNFRGTLGILGFLDMYFWWTWWFFGSIMWFWPIAWWVYFYCNLGSYALLIFYHSVPRYHTFKRYFQTISHQNMSAFFLEDTNSLVLFASKLFQTHSFHKVANLDLLTADHIFFWWHCRSQLFPILSPKLLFLLVISALIRSWRGRGVWYQKWLLYASNHKIPEIQCGQRDSEI